MRTHYRKICFKLNFIQNTNFDLNEQSIGSIFCSYNYQVDRFNRPEAFEPKYVKLDYQPNHVIDLDNKNILVSSFVDRKLRLYDSDFKLIQDIHKINDVDIVPCGLASDSSGNIFLANSLDGTLIKLDRDLRFLKSTFNSYNIPYSDIQVYKNKIYASTYCLKQVDVLTTELVLVSSFHLDHEPSQMRISNDTACILVSNEQSEKNTFFYSLPDFKVIGKYGKSGPIMNFRNFFYVYEHSDVNIIDKYGKHVHKFNNPFKKTVVNLHVTRYFKDKIFYCLLDNCICII
jgi:hypothetical protein